jgi:Tol biopolymer transport system component
MRSTTLGIGAVLLSILPRAALGAGQSDAAFSAEDVLAIRAFAGGQPIAVSSTGRRVAYVLTDQSDEWNVQEPRPTGYVYVQTLGGGKAGAARALTTGAVHSAFPVWSPDGRRLAFIREEQRRSRLIVWDAERDQMNPIGETFTTRVYLAPQWDPTGKAIIVAAPQADLPPPSYRVRSIKSTDARIPGDQFFTDERKSVLKAIDIANGTTSALMTAPATVRSFRVSPLGTHLLYVAAVPETLGVIGKEQNDTFVLPIDWSRNGRAVVGRRLPDRARFSWSPDGKQVLFSKAGRLMALPAEGAGARRRRSFTLEGGASRCGLLTAPASRRSSRIRRSATRSSSRWRPACTRRRSPSTTSTSSAATASGRT